MARTIPEVEALYLQEILVWVPDNRFSYHIETAKIKNDTGAEREIAEIIGMPIYKNGGEYDLVLNAGVANVNAIVVGVTDGAPNNPTIASASLSEFEYFILVKGPAQIVEERIALADPAGTTYTAATLKTGLADEGIKLMNLPPETTTITP
jgi:hypothetical protein